MPHRLNQEPQKAGKPSCANKKPETAQTRPVARSNGKHPGGRPPIYKPEFAVQAEKLCKFGATDFELGQFFEVTTVTIWRWSSQHLEFCNALKLGKSEANERVKRSLYNRAVGYSYESEKIFLPPTRNGKEPKPVRVKTIEHIPPDVTAGIFFMKNREPDEWRDRREFANTTPQDPEAEARRWQAVNTVGRLMEERARMGLPPLFPPKNKPVQKVIEASPAPRESPRRDGNR